MLRRLSQCRQFRLFSMNSTRRFSNTVDKEPKLEVFQAMWSMELRRPDGKENSLKERFKLVKDAGFSGIGLDFATASPSEVAECHAAGPLFKEYGLGCMLTAFPTSIKDLIPYLEYAKKYDARFVTVIGVLMPVSVCGMVPVIREWQTMADDYGVQIHFETHRNCITNDFLTTLQLLDAVPEMTMIADLSHYMVARELTFPITPQDDILMDRLMMRCEHFQGRVSSQQQVQVPLHFPQNEQYVELYKAWWKRGFGMWLQRNRHTKKTMNFMCELGPPPYAITDAEGWELSDRWQESIQLKEIAESIWQEVCDEDDVTAFLPNCDCVPPQRNCVTFERGRMC